MLGGFFDPCPLDPKEDGLKIDWKPFTYVNPPYSEVKKWLVKAEKEIEKGNSFLIVFLVFARTDTRWFQEHIYGKHAYHFIKGRLKFGESKHSAPAPSMLIYMQNVKKN